MAEIGKEQVLLYYLVGLDYMDFWHGGFGAHII